MECCSSPSSSSFSKLASFSSGSSLNYNTYNRNNKLRGKTVRLITCSYNKFIEFALNQTKLHTHLIPSPLQVSVCFDKMMFIHDYLYLLLMSFTYICVLATVVSCIACISLMLLSTCLLEVGLGS